MDLFHYYDFTRPQRRKTKSSPHISLLVTKAAAHLAMLLIIIIMMVAIKCWVPRVLASELANVYHFCVWMMLEMESKVIKCKYFHFIKHEKKIFFAQNIRGMKMMARRQKLAENGGGLENCWIYYYDWPARGIKTPCNGGLAAGGWELWQGRAIIAPHQSIAI